MAGGGFGDAARGERPRAGGLRGREGDAPAVEAVHARGLKLGVWTVNESELARRSAAAGVDAITTDTPGWIRQRLAVK